MILSRILKGAVQLDRSKGMPVPVPVVWKLWH
jgi:hypothetical protein